jgi:hypothetical protein
MSILLPDPFAGCILLPVFQIQTPVRISYIASQQGIADVLDSMFWKATERIATGVPGSFSPSEKLNRECGAGKGATL